MAVHLREVKLPSGAILKIRLAPFAAAKSLYQAALRELKELDFKNGNIEDLMKDLFCIGFSSTAIEKELEKCMTCCQYNDGRGDLKIDKDTFESVDARGDYITVCVEVARDNIEPFMKSLFAQSQQLSQQVTKGNQA